MRPYDVHELIEKALMRAYEEESRPQSPINEIHVSEITYCLRKAYYVRKERVTPPLEKVTVLNIGRAMHLLIEKYIDSKRNVEYEVEVKYPFREITVIGTIDLIVDNTIIELKTVSRKPKEVYQHHYSQVNAYHFMLREKRKDINEVAYIVYINKRNGEIYVYTVIPNLNDFMLTLLRAYQLYHHLISNEPPKPEYTYLCNFCEYRMVCEMNGVNEK